MRMREISNSLVVQPAGGSTSYNVIITALEEGSIYSIALTSMTEVVNEKSSVNGITEEGCM